MGYSFISLASLINFSAISNVDASTDFAGLWGVALSCGIVSFTVAFGVLAVDRLQLGMDKFNYSKAWDCKLEGYTLLGLTLWWVWGVAYHTQVGGVAYLVLNVYWSAWGSLAASIYTLNEWSTSRDILSLDELTGLSATLPSWYVLMLSSMVVTGSSLDMLIQVLDFDRNDALLGMMIGFLSFVVSLAWILAHYNFVTCIPHGGWLELLASVAMLTLWVVVTAVLTRQDGIASTIVGKGCRAWISTIGIGTSLTELDSCQVVTVQNEITTEYSCSLAIQRDFPGSNLYVSTWTCLVSSLLIMLRWKAQQAIRFAQAQNKKALEKAGIESNDVEEPDDEDDDVESVVDLDDFEDAVYED